MSHYQARSLFGGGHRLNNRRNGLGFDRQTVMDRGVGVTIGRRVSSSLAETVKLKELEGEPLLDINSLRALIRLLRLAQVRLMLCSFLSFTFSLSLYFFFFFSVFCGMQAFLEITLDDLIE